MMGRLEPSPIIILSLPMYGVCSERLHGELHHYPEDMMEWWKDWWQDVLVVAMESWLERCWMWETSRLGLGEMKGTAWQCVPGVCISDNDQDMVWEEVEGLVGSWDLH